MRYLVYLLVSLALVGAWVLGIALTPGGIGAVVVTVATMGSLVAFLIYYEANESK